MGGGQGNDTMYGMGGIDTLVGGAGNDTMYGGDFGDFLSGGDDVDALHGDAGDDRLDGGNQNDNLDGGANNDTLTGGLGEDTLTGGSGADKFVFRSLAETTVAAPDDITDFQDFAGDKIDLSAIDANTLVDGNQAFIWIGNDNAFTTDFGAGQLRFNSGVVEGDVDGDFVVDFRIQVTSGPIHDYGLVL
jgi:serralysin